MPRYTPIIFTGGSEPETAYAAETSAGAFSDERRFNNAIIIGSVNTVAKGDIRRFDRAADPAFSVFYAACAADRMYPYDPLVLVDGRTSAFEISRAILGIEMAIHAVMKGRPVILDPIQDDGQGRAMSIGRVTFPAPLPEGHPGKVVLVNSGTAVDIMSGADKAGYLSLASMTLHHSASRDVIPVPADVGDAKGKHLSDLVSEWALRDAYAVGRLTAGRKSLAS